MKVPRDELTLTRFRFLLHLQPLGRINMVRRRGENVNRFK